MQCSASNSNGIGSFAYSYLYAHISSVSHRHPCIYPDACPNEHLYTHSGANQYSNTDRNVLSYSNAY